MWDAGFGRDDGTLLSGRVTADAMHSVVGPPSAAATCSCTPSWQEFRTASRLAMEAGLSRTVGEAVRSVSVAFAGEGFCCSEPVEPESCGCGGGSIGECGGGPRVLPGVGGRSCFIFFVLSTGRST